MKNLLIGAFSTSFPFLSSSHCKVAFLKTSLWALMLLAIDRSNAQNLSFGESVTLGNQDQTKIYQKVTEFSSFRLHPLQIWYHTQGNGAPDSTDFSLNINGQSVPFHLYKSKIFSDGALLSKATPNGEEWQNLSNQGFYRGFANGDKSQKAIFLIRKDLLYGLYVKDGEIYTICSLRDIDPSTTTDGTTTFVRYKGPKVTDPTQCGYPSASSEDIDLHGETPAVDDRATWYFELAYDVDNQMYDKVKAELPVDQQVIPSAIENSISNYLIQATMTVEMIYLAVAPIEFHVVHIQIWPTGNNGVTDPYGGNILPANHITKGKSWWSNYKGCVERDAVCLFSGIDLTASGLTLSSTGIRSICGGTADDACYGEPYNTVRFFPGVNALGAATRGRTIAHELAHNFGVKTHTCECGLMFGSPGRRLDGSVGDCPQSCTVVNSDWDAISLGVVRSRFLTTPGFMLCSFDNPNITFPPDICLRSASITNNGSNGEPLLSLVPAPNPVYCAGDFFDVLFYNQTNAAGNSLTWEYGPYLSETTNQINPYNNKRRKLVVDPQMPCCTPFDTWIRVTYFNNCTPEPITYKMNVRLNNDFTLDGTYVSATTTAQTLNTVNFVAPGSYTIDLASPYNTDYIWEEIQGNTSTTLQWTTNEADFVMPSYPPNVSKTFKVQVPGSCGKVTRTVTFTTSSSPFQLTLPNGIGASIFPNPSNNEIFIRVFDELKGGDLLNIESVIIIDQLGRQVVSTQNNNASEARINISKLPAGTFFAFVKHPKGTSTVKFAKN